MSPSVVWLSPSDPSFPPNLVQYFGDKVPKRIAAFGNLEILPSKAVALICSVKCPGNIILQTYDLAKGLRDAGVLVIGGFHSPMERECLRILLRGEQPIIICPARSLQGMRLPKEYKTPLDQNRLLLLSPFSDSQRRATIHTSLYRNQFVAALADRMFVPFAEPASKTFELCRGLVSWGKHLYTFINEDNAELIKLGAEPLDPDRAISVLGEHRPSTSHLQVRNQS
jgi:predicted Rossmann fold nucleotide-binding protein DprA/Smf involved in DNA uptake